MIKINEWNNYIRLNEMPNNGVFICQPTDAILEPDCWPIWLVVMNNGIIVHQENLYTASHGGYKITNMMGWTKTQFVGWAQFEEHSTGAEETNNFMWVGMESDSKSSVILKKALDWWNGDIKYLTYGEYGGHNVFDDTPDWVYEAEKTKIVEDKEPYWFCVKVDDPDTMYRAMTILGFYKVQMEVIVDGENPEFLIVNGETREGDLVLAEMAFSAPGDVVWDQAKVCPICENNGEEICGHMYFNKCRTAAF